MPEIIQPLPLTLLEVEKHLQSPERMTRQNSLKQILEFCESDQLSSDSAITIYNQLYLNILKCYSDKFEMCRNLAGSIISALLPKLPANDYYLSCLVPAIARRIGQKELLEESEEMRLQLLQQLNEIIKKFSPTEQPKSEKDDRFLKCYNDVIDILLRCLRDPFPAAQRECCTVILAFAAATTCFHYRAEVLAEPLILMLRHRQSPIRIVTIEALGVVVLNIQSNGDCIIQILTAMAPLLMDSIPFVRRACGRVGCRLLLELRDRYSHFDRILPLVLCCLTDETVEVSTDIQQRWEQAGKQYFLENETELAKFELVETLPENYPNEYKRPTLGCRALAQRSLKIVHPVLNEMQDWKEDVRLHSLKLLREIVLHCEKSLAKYFVDISPILCKCCMDVDKDVAAEAMRVAELMGILLDCDSWSESAITDFQKFSKLGHLKCLRALYAASKDSAAKFNEIRRICEICLEPAICHNTNPHYQIELLQLCEMLVGLLPNVEDLAVTQELVYKILIQVVAFAINDNSTEGNLVQEKAETILQVLTSNNLNEFHEKYLKGLIDSIVGLDSPNSDKADPIILLHGLICVCGFRVTYMESIEKAIQIALANAHPDAKIKIFTSISMALLKWKETMQTQTENVELFVQNFIENVIQPYLVWRAGKSCESVRTMATAALCSLSQGVENDVAHKIVSNQAITLTALIEDNSVATRSYALRTLLQTGPIDIQKLSPLAFAVLSRLDDSCAEVRELAAKCLGILKLEQSGDTTAQSSWHNVLKQIIPVMLLHLDDPDIKLKDLVLDSLKMLYQCHRDILKPILDDIPKEYPYKKDVENFGNSIDDEKP